MTTTPLGQKLNAARTAKGLSLRAVERATGIHNAHLSQIESGQIRRPEMSMLFALSQAYEVDYSELLELAGYSEGAPKSGRERQRLTVALREMSELSAKDQQEVLAYIANLRANRAGD